MGSPPSPPCPPAPMLFIDRGGPSHSLSGYMGSRKHRFDSRPPIRGKRIKLSLSCPKVCMPSHLPFAYVRFFNVPLLVLKRIYHYWKYYLPGFFTKLKSLIPWPCHCQVRTGTPVRLTLCSAHLVAWLLWSACVVGCGLVLSTAPGATASAGLSGAPGVARKGKRLRVGTGHWSLVFAFFFFFFFFLTRKALDRIEEGMNSGYSGDHWWTLFF